MTGKFASVSHETVALFSGIMADKKGGFRGCGKKRVFDARLVDVAADAPQKEIRAY
jgi:hypothetical protein